MVTWPNDARRQLSDDARERAYQEYRQELTNSWRGDAGPPAGAYPLSAGEGSRCTINGADGRLARRGDWLVCEPARQDAAYKRAVEPRANTDTPRGMMDAAEARRICDEAWLESVRDLEAAWRKP